MAAPGSRIATAALVTMSRSAARTSKARCRGGDKTLFRLPGHGQPTRLAITEAPIDALSLAAWEGTGADTLYVATGGGMGPGTDR